MSARYAVPCVKCEAAGGSPCVNLTDGSARSRPHLRRSLPDGCGTNGAYQQHVKRGEKPCEPCRIARNDYMRKYRGDPEVRTKTNTLTRVHSRAVWELAARHRDEFNELVRDLLGASA